MAMNSGFPKWLLDGKEHVTQSKDWSLFVEELYDAVQQQLKESHVQAFTDLTAPERQLFMERAAKAIHGGKAYGELYDKVSESLDKYMNSEVNRQLLEEYPVNTKTDLILDTAQDGAVSLLKKWPDMKSKLHVCFNQPLPKSLRQLAWKLFLEDTIVRKKYVDLLSNNPRSAISKLDFEISQKCEQLLLSESTFSQLKGSVGAFYGMKALLSYYHATKKKDSRLQDIEFLLTVPFVMVASSSMPRREPAGSPIVALMVEEYFTFIESRPGYMVDSGSEAHDQAVMSFCNQVAHILLHTSQETSQGLIDAYIPTKVKTPDAAVPSDDTPITGSNQPDNTNNNNNENNENRFGEKILATDAGAQAVMADILTGLVRPLIRTLFVGYVNQEVLLFIWDQYIIGLDAPGYHDELLPDITAIFFMILKDKLKECKTPANVESLLKREGVNLSVTQFQYEIKKHFGKELMKLLNQDDRAALPVLDPTQANYRPWVYWFSDNIPSRVTPHDRRKAREERATERENILQQQKDEEERIRQEEERRRLEEEQLALEQRAMHKKQEDQEKQYLEQQLDQERQQRLESERNAQEQIERLRMEIEDLKRLKLRSSGSVQSLESTISRYLIPPPPTAATTFGAPGTPHSIRPPRIKTPTPSASPTEQADDVLIALLNKVSSGFNEVAHGSGSERQELDDETRQYIIQHKEDVKETELEVFGRRLNPGEFEKMSHTEQKRTSDQIMALIRQKLQDRRQRELNNKGISATN